MLTDEAAVALKKSLLSETHGKSLEELERLLEAGLMAVVIGLAHVSMLDMEETEGNIAMHPDCHQVDSMVP